MMRKFFRLGAVAMVAVGLLLLGSPSGVMAGPVDPTGPSDPDPMRFGSVRGVVIDENGDPVEGAFVTLIHARTKRVVAKAETDENGHFGFRHVRTGYYGVKAGKREVGQGAVRTGVRANETSRVRIRLHKR